MYNFVNFLKAGSESWRNYLPSKPDSLNSILGTQAKKRMESIELFSDLHRHTIAIEKTTTQKAKITHLAAHNPCIRINWF